VALLRRNFYFCSIEDPAAFQLADVIGHDRLMVEMDYPHQDSTWPHVQSLIRSELEGLDNALIRKVCFENASNLYRHPPPPHSLIEASVAGGTKS
jgi:hypothetical protein